MYQTDQATASNTLPAPAAAGTQGYFTNGNPATGVAATIVDADWLNMIQQELINIVTASGETPSKTTYNQVLLAIKRLVQSQVVLTDTGTANAYAVANTPALVSGTWTNGVVQQFIVAHTNTGASTFSPDGLATIPIYGLGLQPLQGGELAAGCTAILMKQTITGINGGNPIAVLLECSGGAQQIPPATASQHAVQFGQVAGVVGNARNLVMSVTAASASAALTADEIIVETALGGLRYCLASFSKTINLGTTGAGGMDIGTAPVSGYVALYAIYNPTGTSALLATNATSAVQPSVYGGGNMPSGYTASALLAVWPTNGSSQFVIGLQQDREFSRIFVQVLSSSSVPASFTPLAISTAVPPNAKSVGGSFNITASGTTTANLYVAGDSNGVDRRNLAGSNPSTGFSTSAPFDLRIAVAQTLYWAASITTNSITSTIEITRYSI